MLDEPDSIVGAVLLTRDPSDSSLFYNALFGWELRPVAPGIASFVRDGVAEALIVSTAVEVEGWVPVIQVEALSATTDVVTASTGAVMPIAEGIVLVEDPLGARCLAAEPGDPAVSQLRAYDPNQSVVGAMSWCQLNSRESRRSADFYEAVFGWTLGPSDNDKFTYWRFYDGRPLAHAGLMAVDERSGTQVPGVWQIYFHGDDLEAAAHRVVERSGSLLVDTTEIVSGAFLVASDPSGHMLGIDRMTHGPVDGAPG